MIITNKYFKVKAKFFKQLFGQDSDSAYAGLKSHSPEGETTNKPAPKNTDRNRSAETQPAQSPTLGTIDTGRVLQPAKSQRRSNVTAIEGGDHNVYETEI